MQIILRALATGLFVSYLPPLVFKYKKNTGAGFVGTLWGIPLVLCLPQDATLYLICLLAFWAFAVWVCKKVQFKGYKGHDNPKIVIDEIAGYLSAMAFLPRSWGYLLAAFVLFRTFDTVKPWLVKNFDRMENAFGVVFDDVAAGLMANILIQLFMIFFA
ncbi:MAG: phosphatidylglycerophosphatase A [Elusimicrobia bacterium]|nr:phosphatidylglycerophosphatase A [Elusimicrobiota bacterium]MDD7502101.1 phosphatidylglycerophosphatase A [Elusimicrobiota bacterium]MDY5729546.1 phosphatidylglycerophosphatase A [Elusimicrobiaceae bacterium]